MGTQLYSLWADKIIFIFLGEIIFLRKFYCKVVEEEIYIYIYMYSS